MNHESTRHRRRLIRLKDYDYSQVGAYFVTICTKHRKNLFGHIENGELILNGIGIIVTDAWEWLARRHDHVDLDVYSVMPKHLNGIIVLSEPSRGGS